MNYKTLIAAVITLSLVAATAIAAGSALSEAEARQPLRASEPLVTYSQMQAEMLARFSAELHCGGWNCL